MKRYRYNQIEKAEPNVTRYKLYKAKTKWVVRGVSTVAVLFGVHEMGVNGVPEITNPLTVTAHANTVANNITGETDTTTDASTTDSSNTNSATNSPVATVTASTSNSVASTDAGKTTNVNDNAATDAVSQNNKTISDTQVTAPETAQKVSDANKNLNAMPTENMIKQAAVTTQVSGKLNTVVKAEKSEKDSDAQNTTQETKTTVADVPYNVQKTAIQQSAQSILKNLQKVVDTAATQAAANNQDKIVNNTAYNALQEHLAQEVNQINVALTAQPDTLPKGLTTEALGLTQANKILTNMRQELDVANQMMAADKAGYDAELVENAQNSLGQVTLPSGTSAKVDEYGDLIISSSNDKTYQEVVNQLEQSGLISHFRYVVDPDQLNYGLSGLTESGILAGAKAAANKVLSRSFPSITMTTDAATATGAAIYYASNITNYNLFAPLITQLQKAYASGTASDIMLATAELDGAYQAFMKFNGGGIPDYDDQQQNSHNLAVALIVNVDENNNVIMVSDINATIKAGYLLNSAGNIVDPTTGYVKRAYASPIGLDDSSYYVGTVGTEIPNSAKSLTVPNFTYVNTTYTTGSSKLVSMSDKKTIQLVINHWTSGSKTTTPTTTALTAKVGNVSKNYDGNATFTTVPAVTVSGLTGAKVPTFTISDFDWSKVQAAAGSYAITLNSAGIKKITDANANTTLAVSAVTAGTATIKPVITALTAKVGNVSKIYDGTATFTDVPTVTVGGLAGVTTPTFTTSDFDWSKVQAAAGSYAITLNSAGIKKITDANANTTLATTAITAGTATIKPVITALTAKVGNVSKTYDGNAMFTTVPTVTVSGLAGVTTPTFTTSDFDWSKVQAAAGSYAITLNAAGIKKITDANTNTTLATTAVTAGTATIKPVITALTAKVGDVSKTYDGTSTFTEVPSVTVSGLAGVTTPTFTTSDFDWSKVQATAGSYAITLNAAGIKKITDANANTTLAAAAVTAGTATIKPAAPTITALTAKVGNVSKTYDGTATFTDVPTVTVGGLAGVTTPTFTVSDFDWTKVQAAAGSYAITLNAAGIKKITDANANTSLATAAVTAGTATIKPVITALTAKVGDVSKNYDGTATFTDVPTVTVGGLAGVTTPTFTVSDFDWSKVQAATGTYAITLNAAGIKKITDANANTTLATTAVTAGTATIKPIITALTAKVGNVSKTYDGNVTFTEVPTVAIGGLAGVTTPTFTTGDFDWSNVQATAGSYAITLNAAGIKKITDANVNTTLATAAVTAGTATINPVITALTAKVGDVSKNYDGTTTFTTVPTVTVAGLVGVTTPTFSASDFDWSQVQTAPGSYAVTLNSAGIKKITDANANTTLSTAAVTAGTATIKPVITALTAQVGDVSKNYDGTTTFTTLPTVTMAGLAGIIMPTFTASDFDWSNVQSDAGSYLITLNEAGINKITAANDYTTLVAKDVTSGTANIKKTAIVITANNSSKKAGMPDPTLTASVTGKPEQGDSIKYTVSRVAGETAGSYDINVAANATDNPNYTITTKAGKFTIQVEAKATVGAVDKNYDGTTTFPEVPAVNLDNGFTAPSLTADDFDWSQVQANVGTYDVTLNSTGIQKLLSENPNMILTSSDITAGKATINKAAVMVKAEDVTKVAGASDPALTTTVSGKPAKGVAVNYTVSREPGEDVGTYAITVTPATNPNYDVAVTPATLTITPQLAQVTVTSITKTYDGTTTFTDTPSVQINGATDAKIPDLTANDFDWSQVQGNVGSYQVSLNDTGKTKVQQLNPNISINKLTAGTAAITPAAITLQAENATKAYGTSDPVFEATVTGKPAQGAKVAYTITRVTGENVGAYDLTVKPTANSNGNYTVTVVKGGKLTITPVATTAVVNTVHKTYDGTTTPGQAPTVTLANGTVIGNLSTNDFDWFAMGKDVGDYAVTLTSQGLQAIQQQQPNYTLTTSAVTPGVVTVDPAKVTVTANNVSKVFQDPDPILTAKVSGRPKDGEAVNYTLTRRAGEAYGTYAITANTDNNPNYSVTFVPGQLTITKATLAANIGIVTKTYDGSVNLGSLPKITLDSGNKSAVLPSLTATDFDLTAVKADVGTYQVTLSDAGIQAINAANPNMTLAAGSVGKGQVIVNPAQITITANGGQKVAGQTETKPTATVTGVPANGVKPVYQVVRTPGENVGSYPITVTASQTDNPNYQITTRNAIFKITPLVLSATIGNVDKTYDGKGFSTVPTVMITGATVPTLTTADFNWGGATTDAGTYTITLNTKGVAAINTANPNATLTVSAVKAGTATIKPAPITIAADDASKDASAPDPNLTATITGKPADGVAPIYTVVRKSGNLPGQYQINVTAAQQSNSNYIITTKPGTFTITATKVTATVGKATKVYDGTTTFAQLPKVTLNGVNGGNTSGLTTGDFDWSAVDADAGTYSVTLNDAGKAALKSANPTIDLTGVTAGSATISKAPAIVALMTAYTKVAGENDPAFTPTVTGKAAAGDPINYTITRVPGEDVGVYDVKVTLGTNKNYDVHTKDTTLTINPANITAAVSDISKTYDGSKTFNSLPTVTISEYSNVDVSSLVSNDFDWSHVNSDAGHYAVTLNSNGVKAINDANPDVKLTSDGVSAGQVTINPAPVTINVDNKKMVYGEAVPKLTMTNNKPVNGTQVQATVATPTDLSVGDHALNVTLGANPNYKVTVKPGTLTVTPAIVQAKVDNVSKVYDAKQAFTTVPNVVLTLTDGSATLTLPKLTADDFDWHNVQSDAGTYQVTLNSTGIKAINQANPNTQLTAADVTAGKAIVTPQPLTQPKANTPESPVNPDQPAANPAVATSIVLTGANKVYDGTATTDPTTTTVDAPTAYSDFTIPT